MTREEVREIVKAHAPASCAVPEESLRLRRQYVEDFVMGRDLDL